MSDELDEIWELYADEGQQSLQAAEEALLNLKKSPTDSENIAGLFRAVHTFKGNSRVMGLSVVESRAHVAEDLIGLVRDKGVLLDEQIIDLLLEMLDVLNDMLLEIVKSKNDVEPHSSQDLVDKLHAKINSLETKNDVLDSIQEIKQIPLEIDDDFFPVNSIEESVEEKQIVIESTETEHIEENQETDFAAVIFEPTEVCLADDPIYREIFAELACEVLTEMQKSASEFNQGFDDAQIQLREQAERLHFAAQQLGLKNWQAPLIDFLTVTSFSGSQVNLLVAHLIALLQFDFHKTLSNQTADETQKEEIFFEEISDKTIEDELAWFFDELKTPLNLLKNLYDAVEFDDAQFFIALDRIRTLAERLEYVQLSTLINRFLETTGDTPISHKQAQDFLFWLFEALVAIEEEVLEKRPEIITHTRPLLGYLCTKQVFENLLTINNILETIKNKQHVEQNCELVNTFLRKVYYACQHYGLETAAQLSTSLIDLFARVTNGNMVIDGFVLRLAKSFVSDIELVLSNLESGKSPDMGEIEKLLNDATSVAFNASVISPEIIEARLGLPKSFHKVLTMESVKIASEALEKNLHFHIVRTDLETNEELTAQFLTWLSSGAAIPVSNVSVFQGNRTLFDFLLATPLNKAKINEALTTLDPKGVLLYLIESLTDHKVTKDSPKSIAKITEESSPNKETQLLPSTEGQLSFDMLESIGELVTHQAMMRHLLRDLAEEDVLKNIETKLNAVDEQWHLAKDDIRQYLLLWQDKIERLIQIEVQTNALMEQLQEEAIAGRMRSAMQLLKPLIPFVETIARQLQIVIDFTTQGDDVSLDFSMLENLKNPLRSLLGFCLSESIETAQERTRLSKNDKARLRLTLIENDDHVKITLEDDGAGIDMQAVAQRATQLSLPNQLDSIFHRHYGVVSRRENSEYGLDFAKLRDALQLQGGNLWVANLPTGGLRFTLTMSLTMLLLEGMVVKVGIVHYVIPIDAIQRIIRVEQNNLMHISASENDTMLHLENNETVPVHNLKNTRNPHLQNTLEEKQVFVILGKEQKKIAIHVNELIGQQNVLSRPLQGYLSHIQGVIGCTLLGSGDVGLVLDTHSLFEKPC